MKVQVNEPVNDSIIAPSLGSVLQRKCACGKHTTAPGGCSGCSEQHENILRRVSFGSANHQEQGVPGVVNEMLRSQGKPLDPDIRAFMEPRFGYDFSQVRVHTDAKAMESASSVNALAYTVGNNIVLGAGQSLSQSPSSQYVLAHELAHVIQQDNARGGALQIGPANDSAEAAADNA